MADSKLVFVLPMWLRPEVDKVYGRDVGIHRPPHPVCSVSTDGEVRMFDGATITEVKVVLACSPYNVEFEDLDDVRIRDV